MIWKTVTTSNQSEYSIPEGVCVGVSYSPQDSLPDLALFFVAQTERPMWHVASLNGQPANTDEAKHLLKKVYQTFNLPCWTMFEQLLIIWPPAINDGDILTVELDRGN